MTSAPFLRISVASGVGDEWFKSDWLGGGLVGIRINVLNQKGEQCQTGRWAVLMLSRPQG